MNEGFQFLDIILFAMVAAFLVLRLRSVLGRRTGHEERPQDMSARREHDAENEGNVIDLADRVDPVDDGEDLAKDAESDDPLISGIAQILLRGW